MPASSAVLGRTVTTPEHSIYIRSSTENHFSQLGPHQHLEQKQGGAASPRPRDGGRPLDLARRRHQLPLHFIRKQQRQRHRPRPLQPEGMQLAQGRGQGAEDGADLHRVSGRRQLTHSHASAARATCSRTGPNSSPVYKRVETVALWGGPPCRIPTDLASVLLLGCLAGATVYIVGDISPLREQRALSV